MSLDYHFGVCFVSQKIRGTQNMQQQKSGTKLLLTTVSSRKFFSKKDFWPTKFLIKFGIYLIEIKLQN